MSAASRYPNPDPAIRLRLFIVGAPRSGTTLLQSLLARHSCIHTFPETGFLLKAFGMRRRLLPWLHLGISLGGEWKAIAGLLAQLGRADLGRDLPRTGIQPLQASMAGVTGVLDTLARDAGCAAWVEKTPRHYLHAELIPPLIPASQVIHVLRDGRDVVASIHHRAREHPERFRRQRRVGYGIHTWNRAVAAHLRAAGRPGHHLLAYDDLVGRPAQTLAALCERLGIEWQPGMLEARRCDTGHILARERWKQGAREAVRPPAERFSSMFTAAAQRRILDRLDRDGYQRLLDMRLRPAPGPA